MWSICSCTSPLIPRLHVDDYRGNCCLAARAPGYYLVSKKEEALLLQHFDYRYSRYMESVGAFIPKLGVRQEAQRDYPE